MTKMGANSTLREAMKVPEALEIIKTFLPEVNERATELSQQAGEDNFFQQMGAPLSIVMLLTGKNPHDVIELNKRLSAIPRPDPGHVTVPKPNPQYETTPILKATLDIPNNAVVGVPLEIRISGPSHGNPFVEVDLSAEFSHVDGQRIRVGGFYDDNGQYAVRFLPLKAGLWEITIASNAASIHGLSAKVQIAEALAQGPIRVDGLGFVYPNGEPYVPFGTTVYAWTHQSKALEETTLETLKASPFNKVRMCVFPKHFALNQGEPPRHAFVKTDDGFDVTRFDVDFFRHLEKRILELNDGGIQADLILFHPYDRWGYADLGASADEHYLRYVVRRFAAFPNIWWSMANEYDFVPTKDVADWHRLARVVQQEDHAGHLLSMHNGALIFDHSADWVTHCSIQRCFTEPTTEGAAAARQCWGKPVIYDEVGYEGDLEWDWGNVTPTEVVRQAWEGVIGGAYITHGETFWNEAEVVFWSKGGAFRGESVARFAFLAKVVAESPTGRLEPIRTGFLGHVGGVKGLYEVQYLGLTQPRWVSVTVPAGHTAEIDILDTWEMTSNPLEGTHKGVVRIELPARPFLAVRMQVID